MHKSAKRFLLIHPFGIGDVLFMTPMIRVLYESGAERIDLLLGSRTKSLFQYHPYVNEIFVVDRDKMARQSRSENFSEISSLIMSLRKNRYDVCFDLSLGREYSFWAFLAGIPKRIGFNYRNRGFFLNRKIELPACFSDKHVVEYYYDLLNFLDFPPRQGSLELHISKEFEMEGDRALKDNNIRPPFIAIAPGGGESWGKDARLKRWPIPNFFELFQKLQINIKGEHCSAIILGSKNEWELGEALRKHAPEKLLNLCGKLSLMASAAVLKRSKLLIANDSGLVHMATAVKTPVIALFGPVDPKVYGPYPPSTDKVAVTSEGPECRPCYKNMRYESGCPHVDCLNKLSVDEVIRALSKRGFFNVVSSQLSRYE